MSPLQTPLTNLLAIQTPIIAAAMAGASGGDLAAAAVLGGGFGFMATGYDSPAKFQSELDKARAVLGTPSSEILPIGVGFLVWQLEEHPDKAKELIRITLSNNVRAVWLSFGHDVGHWIRHIRTNDSRAGTDNAIKIFVQVTSVEEALHATQEWRADIIVIQGLEAGGHGASNGLPLFTLLPLVRDSLSSLRNPPPIVAAGGLATGEQIASMLVLGADGVVLGTRFLLSPESLYSEAQRNALIAADSTLSVRTMAFDHVRNTLGWPKGIDGRALRNRTVEDFDKGENMDILRQRFEEGVRTGDLNRILVWSGTGVGLMKEIKPAKDIMQELHAQTLSTLARFRSVDQ